MIDRPPVIFISNDIVPGCGLPVAAPGLRVYGLAAGMASRGYPVTTVVAQGPVARQWRAPIPPPMPANTLALHVDDLAAYLLEQAPAVVVLTNANQIDRLPMNDGNRYVVDFFAPKLLERVYEGGADEDYPVGDLRILRERKLRAIRVADGFIVNGAKKMPYFLAWILQTDRDLRSVPIELVGTCLPASFGNPYRPSDDRPVRFAMAGYLQGWSVPGSWLRSITPLLEAGQCTLDATLPEHWGGASGFDNPEVDRLLASGAIRTHPLMTFSEYRRLIDNCDVVLDLFDRTRERELAVVTRTIAALCSGKPVVHPPFTEVSPLIAEFDAGWLVDPADADAVADVLRQIPAQPEAVTRKTTNAKRLWAARLDPHVAVAGLVNVIDQIASPVTVPK